MFKQSLAYYSSFVQEDTYVFIVPLFSEKPYPDEVEKVKLGLRLVNIEFEVNILVDILWIMFWLIWYFKKNYYISFVRRLCQYYYAVAKMCLDMPLNKS